MRIVFFGSGEFGLPTLQRLAEEHEVLAIVTQPDRPAGRSQKSTPTAVARWAEESNARRNGRGGIQVIKPQDVNDPGVLAGVRALPAEAWVVIAFGQKLSPALLEGRFAMNLHASLLPRWRGAAPINHAILAGDAETGVSVITLADRMDAGLILGQSRRAIDPLLVAGELHDLLAADGPAIVDRALAEQSADPRFGTPAFVPRGTVQDETRVCKAPKLSRSDAWVKFDETAELCRRRIHGLTPWPGVAVMLNDVVLKLCRVQVEDAAHEGSGGPGLRTGALLDTAGGIVRCGAGTALRLVEVQPAGGRVMRWDEFARGRRPAVGSVFEGARAC